MWHVLREFYDEIQIRWFDIFIATHWKLKVIVFGIAIVFLIISSIFTGNKDVSAFFITLFYASLLVIVIEPFFKDKKKWEKIRKLNYYRKKLILIEVLKKLNILTSNLAESKEKIGILIKQLKEEIDERKKPEIKLSIFLSTVMIIFSSIIAPQIQRCLNNFSLLKEMDAYLQVILFICGLLLILNTIIIPFLEYVINYFRRKNLDQFKSMKERLYDILLYKEELWEPRKELTERQ